jgi:hypothetical protein
VNGAGLRSLFAHGKSETSCGRELLLHGEKRNAVLDLPKIERFGIDSYGDARLAGMSRP